MNSSEKTALEIERRFLVPIDSAMLQATKKKPHYIEQCYLLDSGEWQVRSRKKLHDGKKSYTLTMKRATGHGTCIEIEQEGSAPVHEQIRIASGGALIKGRSIHRLASGQDLELDIYQNESLIPGYAIAEVEISSLSENVILPDWVGVEITGDKEYSNWNLFLRQIKAT